MAQTDTATGVADPGIGVRSDRGPRRSASLLWPLAAVVVTVVVALGRLIVTPSYYFVDDTQSGTAGQWWRLGGLLLEGRLPLLDVHAWTAGNYLAEGQWGIFNPVIWLIAIATRLIGDPLVAITAVKIIALAAMALGTYLLARSFGASMPWAAAAGVAAPLGGFTAYMDAPSWTTGLLVSAVLPWSWWGLRRLVEERRGPLPYLLATAVLVTFGYVFGVIVLVVILAEALVRAIVRRERRSILSVLVAGVFAGLLTIAVYLPGVLTASVTIRDSLAIRNGGFLNADLTDMLSSSTATATASVGAWWGPATSAPLVYILWALPALALVVVPRRVLARLVPLLIIGVILLLVVTGPDSIGPIRWPVRFMPYLVVTVVVAFAAMMSHGRPWRSPLRAALFTLLAVAAGTWVSAVNTTWEWKQVALSGIVQLVGLAVLWFLIYRPGRWRGVAAGLAGALTILVSAVLVIPQMYYFPHSPLPQLAVVRDTSAMAQVPGKDAVDDAIVVGNIYAGWQNPATYDERLVANQWYFSDTTVSSVYTVLPYKTYVQDLCADLRGSTCATALRTLTSTDPTTGREVASLLGVNTLIVLKSSFPHGLPVLPAGWHVAHEGDISWVVVRDEPGPTAGGVAWTSDGTRVEQISSSDTELKLRVDAVGDRAEAVLSRLAWPGYGVSGATQAESVRGYLLTLDLSHAKAGDVVTVTFRPPGWTLEVASLVVAIVMLVGWPILLVVRRRRGARATASADRG